MRLTKDCDRDEESKFYGKTRVGTMAMPGMPQKIRHQRNVPTADAQDL